MSSLMFEFIFAEQGVGALIGGYAGDVLPVARTLASVADCVISHPNVLNAAMLYWPMPNVLYVEDNDIEDVDDYRQGKGIDLLAGVEAIISHLVVKNFKIPCAHAPALLPPSLT
ncbi:hypothetical protein L1887_19149 [Cichorium endivia]|nr:hypothetical protein L1887_19149 [Cichorium endivia]